MSLVECQICKTGRLVDEMYSCLSGRTTTYECIDEDDCKIQYKEYEKRRQQSFVKSFINHDLREEDIKQLSKKEQFDYIYKIKFEELYELPQRFRDGSIHYYHEESGDIYTWSFIGNNWYVCEEKYKSNILKSNWADLLQRMHCAVHRQSIQK